MTMHDGIAQLWCAGHCRVFGEVALNGSDGCILDVLRRGKMRLARAEVDHVDSLRAQLIRLGYHCHSCRGFDAVDSVGKPECFRGCSCHDFLFLPFLAGPRAATSCNSSCISSWNL